MQQGSDDPIGYFLNSNYYEPCQSQTPAGHINAEGNMIYYVSRPNEDPGISGRLDSNIIIRTDGTKFLLVAQPRK